MQSGYGGFRDMLWSAWDDWNRLDANAASWRESPLMPPVTNQLVLRL